MKVERYQGEWIDVINKTLEKHGSNKDKIMKQVITKNKTKN